MKICADRASDARVDALLAIAMMVKFRLSMIGSKGSRSFETSSYKNYWCPYRGHCPIIGSEMCYSAMIKQNVKSYGLHYDVTKDVNGSEIFDVRAFPHTEFPVVVQIGDERVIREMNYSLVPSWSKTRKPKFATYNARVETLCEKPTWRDPIRTHRCLVGFTSFFESCYEGSHAGNVVEFRSRKENLWTAAGLWSEWVDKETGEILESFAVVTTEPSNFIKDVGHDRSPVFLPKSAFESWLKPVARNCDDAAIFLKESYKPLEDAEVVIERPLKPGWEKR